MAHDIIHLGFPLWLRITHYLNIFLIFLLIRSGVQILLDFPRYFFNEHCTPGSEWIKFTRRKVPTDRLWTSTDEALPVSPWIGLPGGRHSLGIGRHWHFFAAILWVINGGIYVLLLLLTGNWRRLIPTSWAVFPDAWHTFLTYISFHIPPLSAFRPYDPLQQLTYAAVVFILGPLVIATGLAMSPAIAGRFPWYPRLFRGRQTARSLHFLFLVAFLLFVVIHVALVIVVHAGDNFGNMVFGREDYLEGLAIGIAVFALALVVVGHVAVTRWSQRAPRAVQRVTGAVNDLIMRLFLSPLQSRQAYRKSQISPYFWVNGIPPTVEEWLKLAQGSFSEYAVEVHGLVEHPLHLTLADLRALSVETQITEHCCIQGWSGIAEWSGVSVREILQQCQPLPQARYVIFHSYQTDAEGRPYYDSLTIAEAQYAQTILAYAMNGETLPMNHGAPLRLRMETKLGFKMVKWIRSIELVENYWAIGQGQGGYREDVQYYSPGAEI